MTYLIDAWLDRPQPYLRILRRDDGQVCASLGPQAIAELQEQGDLDLASLNSNDPSVLKELLRSLFLACYARALDAHAGARTPVQSTSSSSTSNTSTLCGGMLPIAWAP